MSKVSACPVPEGSLLAGFGEPGDYRDCFQKSIPRPVALPELICRFYCSPAFRPERLALSLIGKGASNVDAEALSAGSVESFAAWTVVARSDSEAIAQTGNARRADEILLQDFSGATASWLSVHPQGETTQLRFGSWVAKPDRLVVKALLPLHRAYARVLLGGV